jgi:hypothetical protein
MLIKPEGYRPAAVPHPEQIGPLGPLAPLEFDSAIQTLEILSRFAKQGQEKLHQLCINEIRR